MSHCAIFAQSRIHLSRRRDAVLALKVPAAVESSALDDLESELLLVPVSVSVVVSMDLARRFNEPVGAKKYQPTATIIANARKGAPQPP